MPRILVERRDDFTGGLNLRSDQFQLSDSESPDMMNVEIDPRGGVFSRGSFREINTTAVSGTWVPKRLTWFKGSTQYLMLTTATTVYQSTGTDFSVLNFGAGTPIVSASTNGSSLAQWGKSMYITTGQAGVASYKWEVANTYATALTASGPTWQAYASPVGGYFPKAEHTIQHTNKMFVANTKEDGTVYPNRLRWSHEGLPEDWLQSDFIDFNGGGDGITGLAVVSGHLVVFKPQSIYILFGYDSTDHNVVELSASLGADSPSYIAQSEQGVYFYVHAKGLFYYNGNTVVDLFQNLQPMYPLGYINSNYDDKVSVSYVGRRVWLGIPYSTGAAATETTVNLVYDPSITARGSWNMLSTADDFGLVGGSDFRTSAGIAVPLLIHPTLPRVLEVEKYDSETDLIGGVELNFDTYYRTGWVDGNNYSMKKMFRRPDFVLKQVDTQRTMNVKVFHNFEEANGNERKSIDIILPASATGMKWGIGKWGQDKWGVVAEGAQVIRGSNLGLARAVQLLFTGPVGGEWGINSIAYKYNNRKVTG